MFFPHSPTRLSQEQKSDTLTPTPNTQVQAWKAENLASRERDRTVRPLSALETKPPRDKS